MGRDLRLLRAVFQLPDLQLLSRWSLHLPPAPSVTIERQAFRPEMALIAQPIRVDLTKIATRTQSGHKRGIAASVATKQATGILEMCAVMKSSKIGRICEGDRLRSFLLGD